MYSEKIIEYFLNPVNVGEIENANGIGKTGNSKCGEIIEIYLMIENDVILNARFKAFGSPATIAVSSIVTEFINGNTIQYAKNLENKTIIEALDGMPIDKFYCLLLVKEAVNDAINYYLSKC